MRAILFAAAAALAGCAAHPPGPEDFATLQRQFLAQYEALKVPDFGPAYVKNLEGIGSPEALAERSRFFSAWRARWGALSRDTLDRDARPRYDTLLYEIDFNVERARLEARYLQARPASVPPGGLSALPDGRAWYALYLKRNASREMSPEQLFDFGMAEVARIRGEMRRIQAQSGYAGRDAEWAGHLRANVVTDPGRVAAEFARLRDAVQAAMPKLFRAQVPAPSIKAVPDPTKDTPPGYYTDGTFYFSFFGGRFPGRSFGWLYLHEAIPGHHYQLTLHPVGPGDFWYPASVEGWGAYCEDLGGELGVYATPDLEYGKWEWDLVRSARVALDVGIHDKGWGRDQALAYWRANVPGQEEIAIREIDRITRWPAQVVSYKVGEAALLELKAELARRRGASFDIRDFHARVIQLGVVPVSALERAMLDP